MLRYQLLCTVVISSVLIAHGREIACRECDLSLMYKEWIPCKSTGGCGKSSRFALMLEGDGQAFCPTGCRCYTKEFKQIAGETELEIKAVEEEEGKTLTEPESHEIKVSIATAPEKLKPVTPKPQCKTEEATEGPVDSTRRPLTLPAKLSLCDMFIQRQNKTYFSLYGQPPLCKSLGNRTIYATLNRPDRLAPNLECHMTPLNGRRYTVRSVADKNEVLGLMQKWDINRAWVSRSGGISSEPIKKICGADCAGNPECGECCPILSSTSESGSWLQVHCDEKNSIICVFDINKNPFW